LLALRVIAALVAVHADVGQADRRGLGVPGLPKETGDDVPPAGVFAGLHGAAEAVNGQQLSWLDSVVISWQSDAMAAKTGVVVTSVNETRKWVSSADLDLICQAWHDYEGDVTVFESAVGVLLVGRLLGYDALRVLHSWRTLRKYEGILGISFKDFPGRTAESQRLNGIRRADKFAQFWKALGAGVASEPQAKVLRK
jgi:hypothetical protein